MKALYETTIINNGGRQGSVYSEDKTFNMKVSKPKSLGGDETTATNPEQLFAAGYSACFNSALELVLERDNVKVDKSEVKATITLIGDKDHGGVKLAAKLEVHIIGINEEQKNIYVEKAHHYCPYSKAVKDSIDVEIVVI
ncbi:organic hydroperoxide resistance protein [Salipaludibacillus sp. HK11]|uniref:organic hydroperoxide resistance protein n=1 Tax=Salipaludibacillus sp. HK11 TaxID=3394320 RepID=UPI0039FC800C